MEKKPNILFYFTDQQRPDTIGCYGQRLPVTPVLDALAEDGVVFTNAYTCQPVCGPARSAIFTGHIPRVGVDAVPGGHPAAKFLVFFIRHSFLSKILD